jgi:hypothetical protein
MGMIKGHKSSITEMEVGMATIFLNVTNLEIKLLDVGREVVGLLGLKLRQLG